jgi:hypothetical protein
LNQWQQSMKAGFSTFQLSLSFSNCSNLNPKPCSFRIGFTRVTS